MTTISTRETFAANFESALRNAGMARGKTSGTIPTEPMYWRGQVKDTSKALYLLYSVLDSPETQAADNKPFVRTIYAYGTIYARNGYSDEDYQTLIANIQTACNEYNPKITFLLGGEGVENPEDPDSSIAYINFTAYQKRLV